MASKAAQKRLSKEYVAMQREPPPFIWAVPDEKNILNWNYLIRGPPDSPYTGGEYHGVLMFPPEYPFKPPGIKMYTPSGRFQPDKKICFSMSDFHPGSWNPAWSVATILTGLLSFMLSDEMTTGSVNSTEAHKRAFAARSHAWNLTQARFREAFPEHATPEMRDVPNMGEKERGIPDTPSTPNSGPTTATSPVITNNTMTTTTPAPPASSLTPMFHFGAPNNPLPSILASSSTTSSSSTATTSSSSHRPLAASSSSSSPSSSSPSTSHPSSDLSPTPRPSASEHNTRVAPNGSSTGVVAGSSGDHLNANNNNNKDGATGWVGWRHFFYEKWRLCAVIALAVLVSKFSRA